MSEKTPQLPADATAYKRTPVFDAATIPAALTHEHRTKRGTWALIQVLSGSLLLRRLAPEAGKAAESRLVPGTPGVIRPEEPHEVTPGEGTRFYVEFYRQAEKP